MNSQTDMNNLTLTADPEAQNDTFLAAFNSGDGRIFDQLYRDDAISNLSGGPLSGAVRTAAIVDLLATKPTLRSTVKRSFRAGDTSLIVVAYELNVTGGDGERHTISGICTDVLVEQPDGTWKMVIDRPVARD